MILKLMEQDPNENLINRLYDLEVDAEQVEICRRLGLPMPSEYPYYRGRGILPAIDFEADPISLPPIISEILASPSLLMLGGAPGGGKTFLSAAAALAIASGSPFLGHDVPYRRNVLYLDYENSEREIRRRFNALGFDVSVDGNRLRVVAGRPKITSDGEMERVLREVDDRGIEVVFIDTLTSAAALDENSSGEVEAFYDRVWSPLKERGVALWLLHHTRKSQQGGYSPGIDRYRGSGHLVGRVDHALLLDKQKFALKLTDVKHRHAPELGDHVLEIADVQEPGGIRVRLAAQQPGTKSANPRSTPSTPTGQELRQAALLGHISCGLPLSAAKLAKLMDVSVSTISRDLTRLVDANLVVKIGESWMAAS